MDSYYATPLADELELDLISSFDGLGRFASSAPPSPALPSSVPSSVEGTPVQGTRELGTSQLQESSDYPLPFDRYVHAGAPPGAKLMDPSHAGSTSSTPVLIWTGAEKENVKKEKHVVGSIVNTEDNAKTPWPTSCLLFWPESRFSLRTNSTTSRSSKNKPTSLPRETLGSRPGPANYSPHPSSPLSPRFSNR